MKIYNIKKSKDICNLITKEYDFKSFQKSISKDNLNDFKKYLEKYNIPIDIELCLLFFSAVELKSINIVKYIADNKLLNINERTGLALRIATQNNDFQMLKYLDQFPETNIHELKNKCLSIACEKNNWEIIEYILNKKDVKLKQNSCEPLRIALLSNNSKLFKFLYEKSKKIDPLTYKHSLLLFSLSIKHKNNEVRDYLIEIPEIRNNIDKIQSDNIKEKAKKILVTSKINDF